MAQIIKLSTMHCGRGSSDKVYGIVIVKADNNFYSLYTFYGPRGKVLNVRRMETAPSSSSLLYTYNTILRDKQRKYDSADWRDPYFGMLDTVHSLGSLPGETTQPAVEVVQAVKSDAKPAAKPQTKRRAAPVIDHSRSFELRDF